MKTYHKKTRQMEMMDKRRRDVMHFESPSHILGISHSEGKSIKIEDVGKLGSGELIYLTFWVGMGTDDRYSGYCVSENGKFEYYITYYYMWETHNEIIDDLEGFEKVAKVFKGLEDFDANKWHEYYHNGEKLENFEYVQLGFGNFVLVNKKYFENYNNLVKELSKIYDIGEDFFWINITTVSKIYNTGEKDKFLSLAKTDTKPTFISRD